MRVMGLNRHKGNVTRIIIPVFIILIAVFASSAVFVQSAEAAASVTIATGGSNLSVDTARIGGSGVYTTLTGPAITEVKTKDVPVGSMILTAPTGYEFDTTANSVTVTVTGTVTLAQINTTNTTTGQGTTKNVTPTSSTITIWVTAASGGSGKSTFTWSGIKVRPINGTPLAASGNITYSGTSGEWLPGQTWAR